MKKARIPALLAVLLVSLHASSPAQAEVTPKIEQKIRRALPTEGYAPVAEPREVLVFTLTLGYRHASIPAGIRALELLGKQTGAFNITQSEDTEMFRPSALSRFDVVCFLNATGELFEDEERKTALLDFVKGGKGVVGIHAATDCFYNWPEFGGMMGAYFDGHPWMAHSTVTLKVEDTEHACNQCFEGRPNFTVKDEIYQFRPEPYSRDVLRILTSVDTKLTNMKKKGIKRTDGDFGVSWVRRYGQGRVFYCSVGHRDDIYWNPTILGHYLAGIQFAAGDLAADTTPSAELVSE